MPAVYTHYLIAEKAFTLFPKPLQAEIRPFLTAYLFGAQGADFCFFYKPLNTRLKNFGSYLHREGGYHAFRVMKAFAVKDGFLRAYALGYLTHYAADVVFHPYVYHSAGKSPLRHTRIESAIDVHFRQKYQALENAFSPFYKKPTKAEQNELYLLFAAIATATPFAPLSKPAFFNAISLFNAYPPISFALFGSKNSQIVSAAVNAEKRLWSYPSAAHIQSDDNADELFEKAVRFALSLIREFLFAAKNRRALPLSRFGKNYLTGI